MTPVALNAERLLSKYDDFAHLSEHIRQGTDQKSTMCMNKHLLAGATMPELLDFARSNNKRLNSNDFKDAPRIIGHINWCNGKGMIVDKNKFGVYRIVGYQGRRDSKVMEEFLQQKGFSVPLKRAAPEPLIEKKPEIHLDEDITLDDENHVCKEGTSSYILHRKRERNMELVRLKKESALKNDPLLRCEACATSMQEFYGERGASFCEVHHRTPLFLLSENETTQTSLDDLAILCPNCHRMVHRSRRDTLTVDSLKEIVNTQKSEARPAVAQQ